MMDRKATVVRKTKETEIDLELNLDGDGSFTGTTGIGFLDHMLELLAKHGDFSLILRCRGDLSVDGHHTAEDIGLSLGQAFSQALGDKRGIARYGSLALPMDEVLVLCAVDISGRPGFFADLNFSTEKIGQFDTQLVGEFWQAFANQANITLHLRQLAGGNSHHLAEAVFKGTARCMKTAVGIEGEKVPSTKGVL